VEEEVALVFLVEVLLPCLGVVVAEEEAFHSLEGEVEEEEEDF
jgi:hypothetical protein